MSHLPVLVASSDLLPDGGPLNGRRSAGQTLLGLWSKYSASNPLAVLASKDLRFKLEEYGRRSGHTGILNILDFNKPEEIVPYGGLFLPDPSIGRWSQWRASIGSASFSLIGQTHTLSTPASMSLLKDLAVEPTKPWDALICSSNAGKEVVESVIEDTEQQIFRNFSIQSQAKTERPYLPVIPLPINTTYIRESLPSKNLARNALGIDPNAHVALWLGRLSMLTKVDPWPTYLVLQQSALALNKPLIFIECGPDDTSHQAKHFQHLKSLCPNVQFLRVGGEKPVSEQLKFQCIAASDIAVSLVDNTQETFGLSVAEAMAAGIPVVASDWNGYRDLVRDGIDGFLIPTKWSPLAKEVSFRLGWASALGTISYPVAAGCLSQLVQIDLPAAVAAIIALFSQPAIHRAMGEAAKLRAEKEFSYDVVMKKYLDLFEILRERREAASDQYLLPEKKSITIDPVTAFASYPSLPSLDNNISFDLENHVSKIVKEARQPLWDELIKAVPPSLLAKLEKELLLKHQFKNLS